MNDITIDLAKIAALIVTLGVIARPIWIFFKKLWDTMHLLEHFAKDIDTSKKERKILVRSNLACLQGLAEQGCNGPVLRSIKEIEDFMLEESHKSED